MTFSGKTIDSSTLEVGLRELCPGLHFDMGVKLGIWHPMREDRQGVFYNGRHLCSMDRGPIPEFKQWSVAERQVPASFGEADRDGVSIKYAVVPKDAPGYKDAYDEVRRGRHEHLQIRSDGELIHLLPVKTEKVKHRVVRLGWRHTLEGILRHNLPGITRSALSEKFGVDMLKYPVGSPDEVIAELVAE